MTSKDGTLRIERVDASAECDGLVPTRAPDVVAVAASPGPYGGCGGPGSVSDGTGHVALGVGSGNGWREWQAFTPGGGPRERFTATHWRIFPQPEGWIAASASARSSPFWSVEVDAYSPDGSPRARVSIARDGNASPIHQWAVAEDPLGGVLLVHAWHDMDGSGRCSGDARRVDATGAARGSPADVGCWAAAAGVSRRGEALVLEDRGGALWAHWIRADGTPAVAAAAAGATEDLTPRGTYVDLVPLLDGSLVVSKDGAFARRYPHLAARSEPAPAWLAARAGWTFRNTRGNRGYAFFPRSGAATGVTSPDCSQTIDLLAPSGRRCGKVTLLNPGGACLTNYADQGWDGTIVEKNGRETCSFRWWPRALAGD